MKTRFLTGVFIILGLLATLFLRSVSLYVADAVITVLAMLCCYEVSKAFNNSKRFTNITLTTLYPALFLIGVIIGVVKNVQLYYYFIFFASTALVCIIFNLIMPYFFKEETKKEIEESLSPQVKFGKFVWEKTLNSMLIFIYPALFTIPFLFLNHLTDFSSLLLSTNANVEHFGLFVWFLIACLFVVTMLTDTGAYLIGSAIKGKKLCPKISPNKTISGAIGGLIFGTFGAFATAYVFTLFNGFEAFFGSVGGQVWHIVLIGVLGSILTQVGDIFESFLKRRCQIKDFGKILPGHGGVMDRVDGLVFNALFLFVYALILL